MKVALCKSLTGADGIEIDTVDVPVPADGEVRVAVAAVGLNFMDTLITRGKYQDKPDLPFAPGGEIAGVVEAVGSGVAHFSVGDRVCAYVGHGGAAERIVVAADRLVAVPDAISLTVAAGLSVTYGTAMHGLMDRGGLRAGETVAVLGASGGAGLAAVEVAKLAGARVIAVGSSPEKLEICLAHGADEMIATQAAGNELKDALRAAAAGGLDLVYDCVGGDFAEPALRALAPGGRFLVVGFAAGDIPRLPLNIIMLKGLDVRGIAWGPAAREMPQRQAAHIGQVMAWIGEGRLSPRVHATRPLSETAEAIRDLAARKVVGKLILTI